MKCIRCNYNNPAASITCKKCGADLYIDNKTKSIAAKLYNKGLAHAQERRLTEALEALKKSVYFDRFSIDARNVLGLVYFELGMVADALKQWAISASYYGEKNPATGYIAQIKANRRQMERMNDGIKLYNKGLADFIHRNDDMAVIQLKKAINLNPKLIEAKNLLACIYIKRNELQLAKRLIQPVCEYDLGNEKADRYQDALGQSLTPAIPEATLQKAKIQSASAKYEALAASKQYTPPAYQQEQPLKPQKGFPLREVISLLIGVVCAVAVMFILVIPSLDSSGRAAADKASSELLTLKADYEQQLQQRDETIAQLTEANTELESINNTLTTQAQSLEIQQKLTSAASLSSSGKLQDAASILRELDGATLSESERAQHQSIKATVYPQLGAKYFSEGRSDYLSGNYDAAKNAFISGLGYGMTNTNAGDAYYYLGKIAEANNETEKAIDYYNRTINEFSECTQYRKAITSLNDLT